MKRLLTIIVALALFGLGPVPLSLCAQLSSKAAECVTSATESECNRMGMGKGDVKMSAAPNSSCCDLSQAPISDRQQSTSEVGLVAILQIVQPNYLLPKPFGNSRLREAKTSIRATSFIGHVAI